MKPVLFVLCDAATDSGGKLNILGIFDTFLAKEVPFTHPMFCIAIRLAAKAEDKGEHKIGINIVGENKKSIVPVLESKFKVVEKPSKPINSGNLIATLRDMKFEKIGDYSVLLTIDDKEIETLQFHVIQIEPDIHPN